MARPARGLAGDPPHPLRAVQPSARRGVDRVPARPGRGGQACAVGAGAHGDPRGGADLSAGHRELRDHSRHRAGCPLGAVGDGGGLKVRRARSRDRRAVGRPGEPRLHRDAAAGSRRRAIGRAGLAGAAERRCEFERRADALAARERAVAAASVRSASSGRSRVGRRAVPRPRPSARPVEHHP